VVWGLSPACLVSLSAGIYPKLLISEDEDISNHRKVLTYDLLIDA